MAGQNSTRGWSNNRRRLLLFIPVICIFFIIILQYYLVQTVPKIPGPNAEKIDGYGFDYCFKDHVLNNGKNFTIYDGYMNICNGSCHGVIEFDKRTLEAQKKCSPDPRNFFMFWSTKREDFKLKHFRVIDSIFTHHPNARLHFFTTSMNISDFSFYSDRFDVVHHPLEPEKIFKDTPLERWAHDIEEWKKSSNYFSHVTDAMRLALLWKYGGVYLDTDAPILRNIENIRNALGVQHPSSVYKGGEINGKLDPE
jgi:hypothetical protein